MSDKIDQMVSRFLAWKLPKTVCPDAATTDPLYPHDLYGTNLLTTQEARQMFVHVLSERPAEPAHDKAVWYRGWEIGWNDMAAKWAGTGWDAYKGGCDLGAPRITSSDFSDCLDEIDDYEEGEA